MLPWTTGVTLACAAAALLAVVRPALALASLAKEGPVEHVSHVVLAAAIVAWVLAAARAPSPARVLACAMACFLALVLAEEIDWGAVYGWTPIGEEVAASLGHRNFHNAARGSSYLLFALPLVAYFLAPGTGRWLGPLAPSRDERWAFAVISLCFFAGNMCARCERAAQELLELLLYMLLFGVGGRIAIHIRRPSAH